MSGLTAKDVTAMGLGLEPLCSLPHGKKMKPHHHIGGTARGIDRHEALHGVLDPCARCNHPAVYHGRALPHCDACACEGYQR